MDAVLVGLRAAGLHQIADEVETGELFQKDVDDGSWGSEWKGQDDKGDRSSSDGDTDDDGDSGGAALRAPPFPAMYDEDTSALYKNFLDKEWLDSTYMPNQRMSSDSDGDSNDDDDDDVGGSPSLPATCTSTDLPDDDGLLRHDLADDCHTIEASNSTPAVGDIEDPTGTEVQKIRIRRRLLSLRVHFTISEETQVNTPKCTFTPTLYPTGEDALAWNDCLQDFFKTDEDTARSIQESWPSNLLVKHLIRDRFFHSYLCEYWEQYQSFPGTLSEFLEFVTKVSARKFSYQNDMSDEEFKSAYDSLCVVLGKTAFEDESNNQQCLVHQSQLEWDDVHQSSFGLLQPVSEDHDDSGYFQFVHDSIRQFLIAHWVVHSVTTDTEGEQQLKDFLKKSAALPLSCYCVAHLLGQSDGHRNHLLQFVDLLIQAKTQLGIFDHLLHVVSTAVESGQPQILTPSVQALFPENTLDLLSLPEISFHGLHSLAIFMSKTSVATEIKLPNRFSCKNLFNMYPFSKSKAAKDVSHYQQIRCLSYLPLFQTESRYAESLYFKITDKALIVDHIEKYLLHSPSLTTLTVQKKDINIGFSKIVPGFLFTPSLRRLTFRGTKSSVRDYIKSNVQSVARRCLASCRELNVVRIACLQIADLPLLPNLEQIDLSHNAINDEAVPGLSKGLGSCQNLKKVNLSHNKLSDRGDFLPPLPNLEEIDLSYNAISDEALPGLAKCLSSCEKLKTACLTNNRISNKGALLLLLQGQYKQLQLQIWGNSISGDLVSLLSNRKYASQVTKLDLTYGEYFWSNVAPLRTTEIHLLLQFLPQLPNLQELALCVSCQGEEEAEHINQLYGVRDLLKKLKLKDWSLDNIIILSTQMFQHFRHMLEEIDLSHNGISDEATLAKVLASCQKLKKVNLSYNKLSDRGDFLPSLPNLEEIALSHNNISDEAVPGLAKGLALSQNLGKVNLSHNKLSDVGELIEAFSNFHFVTRVDIEYNSIRDESLPAIAAWLNVSTAVEEVRLYGNSFSAEGVRDFVRTMKGKAYWLGANLLYDGSQADVDESVESGGEGAEREEQQWERLRRETDWILVKVRQLTVRIDHKGPRSNIQS